jgi:hypothetical protein
MRTYFLPLTWFVALSLSGVPALAKSAYPVVVELFTSQGCSSCPPADAVLADVAQLQGVIALSRPVTYWDRLGWKDSLARPQNTQLQYDYASRFGNNGVYTPQAVVNGRTELIGSHGKDLRDVIVQAQTNVPASRVDASRMADGRIKLRWQGPRPDKLRLHFLTVSPKISVAVRRGENGGRTLIYTNVVRDDVIITAQFDATGTAYITVPNTDTAAIRNLIIADTGQATTIVAANWLS